MVTITLNKQTGTKTIVSDTQIGFDSRIKEHIEYLKKTYHGVEILDIKFHPLTLGDYKIKYTGLIIYQHD